MTLDIRNIGEYTVTYTLKLSEAEINYQTDYYLTNNTSLYTIQHFFEDELNSIDLSGLLQRMQHLYGKAGYPDRFYSQNAELAAAAESRKIS